MLSRNFKSMHIIKNGATIMKKGHKRPHYSKRTKKQVIEGYFKSSPSLDELSEINRILGSNIIASWLKKNRNLGISYLCLIIN
jgi:hypothetical protein